MQAGVMSPQPQLMVQPPLVVICDDDPAVCNSLKFSLELEGFVVRAYRSGAELLHDGPLDDCNCFVIDQRMPSMNGMELIAKLRDQRIAAPAILIISQPNAALKERAALANIPIVEKPLLGNALLEQIRSLCHPRR
jgi:two-component system, LuxR family, response regulator FixJ